MMAHGDETDDSHLGGRFHPGCGIVPCVLAAAQLKPANGEPDKAPSFVEFCDEAIAAATVLYGECSDNVVRVANAFAAVGLVKNDFTCDGYLGACVDVIEIDFTLTPEDCLNDPNFDPNGGWQDAVDYSNIII